MIICDSLYNYPVQGTAADGFKLALIDLNDQLAGQDARIVHILHDEVIVEGTGASDAITASAVTRTVTVQDSTGALLKSVILGSEVDIVTIEAKIRDVETLRVACDRLGLDAPAWDTVKLFTAEAKGYSVWLPGWRYPGCAGDGDG